MASTSTATVSPKKANLLDHPSVKHLLDESVAQAVKGRGYAEDTRIGNLRMLIGAGSVVVALAAHFYPRKFPENRGFLIACIALYVVSSGVLMLIAHWKQKSVVLFTHPQTGNSTGLMISSKMPRFSDIYTLTVASADTKSIFARRPVQLAKSVTKWFTKDGFLVESFLWKDVDRLIDEHLKEMKKRDLA